MRKISWPIIALSTVSVIALAVFYLHTPDSADLVTDVRGEISNGAFDRANARVESYQLQNGDTSELAAAISWLARGALAAQDYTAADLYANRARNMGLQLLGNGDIDNDRWLPTAIGAGIEVHAQVLDHQGKKAEGAAFLKAELEKYRDTSIAQRISKNINLLSLVGSPAPAIEAPEWLGEQPASLASLRGKPVLLFFWAHWCPDCKADVPIIANVMRRYSSQGLQLVAPTQYYGYAARGEDATPAEEKVWIQSVQDRFYAPLENFASVPISNENFQTYGCSTTPTLAIVDKNGNVSWYHPGAATEAELVREVEKVL